MTRVEAVLAEVVFDLPFLAAVVLLTYLAYLVGYGRGFRAGRLQQARWQVARVVDRARIAVGWARVPAVPQQRDGDE